MTLSAEQRAAAHAGPDGAFLIAAGPGTGKTFTATERFCWLVERGVAPDRILTGTFNDRAGEELRFSQEPQVLAFLEKHDAIPDRDRRAVTWEAIALAAEVDPATLLGAAILAIQSHSANAVKIIALSNHPEMTRKRVEFGKLACGVRDRDALDTALGFLPQTKGSTFIINPGGGKPTKGDDDEPEGEDDIDHLFPSLSETQEKLLPLRARLLEAGS